MTLNDMIQKTVAAGFVALTVGGGAMIVGANKDNAVQDQRLTHLEAIAAKLDAIQSKIDSIDGKVNVLNQKFDDQKK